MYLSTLDEQLYMLIGLLGFDSSSNAATCELVTC